MASAMPEMSSEGDGREREGAKRERRVSSVAEAEGYLG